MKTVIYASAISIIGAGAQASTIDAIDLIQSYNAIALGDFTMAASHVEGTMYVGGNLQNDSATDVNGDNQIPSVIGGALVVGGDVTGNEIRVLNGDAQIGGSANGNVAMNGGGTLSEGASIDTAGVEASLKGLSAFLATMTTTAGAAFDSTDQNAPLTLGPGDANGYVVLNLSESDANALFAGNINNLDTSGYNGVFINVEGDSFDRTGNWNAQANNVILNLFEATSFDNSNGNLNFSVLSPFADVTLAGGGMNGFVVGETITNRAEIRPPFTNQTLNFGGTLPEEIEMAPVPLPAAGWMLFAALGGVLGLRRFA